MVKRSRLGKHEIYFVVQAESRLIPYQVTWSSPLERHRLAFEEFLKEFPNSEGIRIVNPENAAKELG